MGDRKRYVLVRRRYSLGSLAEGANDIASAESTADGSREGTARQARRPRHHRHELSRIDYVDPCEQPAAADRLTPDNIYIPSAPSTVGQIVNSASEIMERLHPPRFEGVVNNLNKS